MAILHVKVIASPVQFQNHKIPWLLNQHVLIVHFVHCRTINDTYVDINERRDNNVWMFDVTLRL